MRDAVGLIAEGKVRQSWRAALVDESQDMTTTAFRLLRAIIPEGPDDLFVVGDGHQRIYRRKVVLSHAGVHIVGRSHRLRINYRTTDEIRQLAVGVLHDLTVDDLDGGDDSTQGYRSLMHGATPEHHRFEHLEDEFKALADWIRREEDPRSTCVVTRTNPLRERYREALEARGVETRCLSRATADDPAAPGVRLATMHRVKGLEFDRLAIVGLNRQTMPLRAALDAADDPGRRADVEQMERSLLYVAMTRARRALWVSGVGEGSPFLSE